MKRAMHHAIWFGAVGAAIAISTSGTAAVASGDARAERGLMQERISQAIERAAEPPQEDAALPYRRTLTNHADFVNSVEFSPDRKSVV